MQACVHHELTSLRFVTQDMAVYETYIMGMLTNFDAGMPLDRIHNMLKMFVVDPPYDKSADQLAAYFGSEALPDERMQLCEFSIIRCA